MLVRIMGKRKPYTRLVGMQTITTTMEKSMEVPQNLKLEMPYDPIIPI
jgi:hypothetical protein